TVERLRGREPVPAGTHLLVDLPPGAAGSAPAGARLRVAGRLDAAADHGDPGWWYAYVSRLTIAGRLRATSAVVVGRRGGLAGLRSGARERWYVLLAGLAGLLAAQPRSLGDPGLQLSFGAVVGLFAVAPPLAAWLRGWLPARLAELAGLTLGAGLATAPV